MAKRNEYLKNLAKRIVETTAYDPDSNTLFVSNPGISAEVLKSLAKKHNFTIGQVGSGEYVSIPGSFKYTKDEALRLYDDFLDTYTIFSKNYEALQSVYSTLDTMDENVSEITLILNTYVAEVLSQGFIDDPLKIVISDPKAQTLIDKVFYRNKIYNRLPEIVRNIAKYGNYGMILQYPYLEQWQTDDDSEGFNKLDIVEDLYLTSVNPKYFKVNTDEFLNPINYETTQENRYVNVVAKSSVIAKTWQPWQFVHFLLPDEATAPYGKSMLWSMRSAFDQLTTLEALLGISRASNIQRLVFTVPMPNGISMVDAYGFMNEFRSQYLNSIFTDYGTSKAGRKIPGALSILTLPETHDGKKVGVDKIEANIDLSSTEDVQYFLDKILRNSALPKGYLVGEDVITTSQALDAQDLKLKRTLIPLKQALITGIMTLVENILAHAGYDVTKLNVDVSLNEPVQVPADVIEKYGKIMEFVGGLLEFNPQMPNINKFQLLVKLGMPTDLSTLICAQSSVSALDIPEDLARFLLGQKVKDANAVPTDAPELEETTSVKLSSKQYLNENARALKQLKNLCDVKREKGFQYLAENALKSEKTINE